MRPHTKRKHCNVLATVITSVLRVMFTLMAQREEHCCKHCEQKVSTFFATKLNTGELCKQIEPLLVTKLKLNLSTPAQCFQPWSQQC